MSYQDRSLISINLNSVKLVLHVLGNLNRPLNSHQLKNPFRLRPNKLTYRSHGSFHHLFLYCLFYYHGGYSTTPLSGVASSARPTFTKKASDDAHKEPNHPNLKQNTAEPPETRKGHPKTKLYSKEKYKSFASASTPPYRQTLPLSL